MGRAVPRPPKIFNVNWFRTDANGKFAWPGFGQNMRVLKWIVDRCHERGHGVETALGVQPEYGDLDWGGLDFSADCFRQVMCVERELWQLELAAHDQLLARLGSKQPGALAAMRRNLGAKLVA
jgi:phosphoenolpyruvate carboxykinase (GTP)